MNKKFLTLILVCSLLFVGISACYAANTPPTTPTLPNPAYYVLADTQVDVFWNSSTDSAGVAGYYIYRCMGANCTLPSRPTINVNSSSATDYIDGTLSAGTTYNYTIAAYDAAGNVSAQSSVISVTMTGSLSIILPVITVVSPVNGVGNAGQSFSLSMTQSSLQGGGLIHGNSNYSWNWDYGDGTSHTGDGSVTHVYSQPGSYVLTLTIYNINTGDLSSAYQTITVLPAASVANLALRLPLNGDIIDYSGNQLQTKGIGAVPSFTTGTPCVTGLSLTPDGTANGPYVSVSDNGNGTLDGNAAASLALFVQKNVASASGTVYVKQGVYSIAIASQGVSASLTNSTGGTVNLTSSTVPNNDTHWHHYALTYNGTTVTLYFDGTAVATQALSGSLAHVPSSNLLLGKTISGNTFNGSLSTVRYYNAALTAAQVGYLFNGTQFGDINGVVNANGYEVVSIYDAFLVEQYLNGKSNLSTTQLTQGAVSLDGNPSSADALMIAEKAVGLILKFPADLSEE